MRLRPCRATLRHLRCTDALFPVHPNALVRLGSEDTTLGQTKPSSSREGVNVVLYHSASIAQVCETQVSAGAPESVGARWTRGRRGLEHAKHAAPSPG